MKKTKRIVTIFSIVLIALAMMAVAVPVLAAPTDGQKVAVTYRVIPPSTLRNLGETTITPGGIYEFRGLTEVYPHNKLTIGTDAPLTVFACMVESGSWNSQTKVAVINCEATWYISTGGSADGFFGHEHMRLINYDMLGTHRWTDMQIEVVLHGFGSYEGQTLMISYSGPASPVVTGYCLKG